METNNIETMATKANEALGAIQSLEIAPTEHNVTRLAVALRSIQEMFSIARKIDEEANQAKEDANKEPAVTEEEV